MDLFDRQILSYAIGTCPIMEFYLVIVSGLLIIAALVSLALNNLDRTYSRRDRRSIRHRR